MPLAQQETESNRAPGNIENAASRGETRQGNTPTFVEQVSACKLCRKRRKSNATPIDFLELLNPNKRLLLLGFRTGSDAT